ncbi:MAG: hypothetical protein EAZ44_03670 [Cytophagia bacterium]|nr:MAG: hypothetical protein EAZ44_03670 [Cytophagia bacterium]TAG43870.1 MAG: hypothetical protein EAZ31_03410 [Cytophagia bacterium]TAH30141.1 MAG: hypothetical protein EAZ06_04205 [Cytophagales bacterium]
MEAIYKNEKTNSVTSADRDKKYYLMYAENTVSDEDFKGGFNAILEDVKINKFTKIIMDLKKVSSTPFMARTWLVSTYLPELYKNSEKGALKIGIINTDSWIEGATISLLVTTIQGLGFDLGIKFYKTVEEAKQGMNL